MTRVFTRMIGYLERKPGARVPKLEVIRGGKREVFALVADRYRIGRNPKECDIVVVTPLISQIHAELVRDQRSSRFFIRDQDSTNGIYCQRGLSRQRIRSAPLRHNARISLGPPELKESITLRFIDPPPWYVGLLYGVGKLIGLLFLVLLLGIGWEWQRFSVKPLPPFDQGPIEVLAEDGTSISPADRPPHTELKTLEEFGQFVPQAVVISEDRTFYWNIGIDPVGILRAIVTNVRKGQLREGASTITQQLARNALRQTYVGTGDTPGRKWREMVAALKLTATYSKREILTFYLNRVYMGYGVHGFRDASLFYFAKEPSQLSLSEAATLAGILPAPERINPFRNKQLALEYRDRVLQRLANAKKVTPEEAERARRSVLKLNTAALQELQSSLAPYFYNHIFGELTELLGENFAREGNLIVATDLNLRWQEVADRALQNFVALAGPAYNFSQGAILTIDTRTGAIKAMTGGVNFKESQFNRASQAQRQPGSTFKLFAYGAALEGGISPDRVFDCSPLGGVSGCRSGTGGMDMYTAFALSENVVAIRVGETIGLNKVIKLARELGIKSKLEANSNMVLGGYEVTMPEMAGAYSAVVNGGGYVPVHGIVKIWDSADCQNPKQVETCRLIYEADTTPKPVLSPQVASILQEMMALVVTQGTGRAAALPQTETIGKTGTTDNNRDLWFIGIAPAAHTLTAVWLGNDEGVTNGSSSLAAQLWGEYMAQILF